jgi:glutamate-1-semialdehyde aminotransferase
MSIKARADKCIGQGALTNSKHPDRFSEFVASHVTHGKGAYLYDTDGNEWLDFVSGLGTNHFGYGNEFIVREMLKHAYEGDCHSLPTVYEVEAAEAVKATWPWTEKVKWVNDGSSACAAAVEMARVSTGKSRVLYQGYHGWHPEFISQVAYKPNGNCYNYRRLDDLEQIDEKIAAVIVEPVELDCSRHRIDFLKKLRDKCDYYNVVLIFDEVITGVRYKNFGVSNSYGIRPDLILLGKALGNGAKIACVAGRKDILDGEYFVSGTYHGHIHSLIQVIETLKLAKNKSRYDIEALNYDSKDFFMKINILFGPFFRIEFWGCRGAFKGDSHYIALFQQEMAKAKILFCPSIFCNFYNIKETDRVLDFAKNISKRMLNNDISLIGKAPTPALASTQRS